MQYTSISVSEVNTTAALCAVITAGAVGKNATVILKTHPITGMYPIVRHYFSS